MASPRPRLTFAWLLDLAFWLVLLLLVAPVIWIAALSFRSVGVIISGVGAFLSGPITTSHYATAVLDTHFLRWLANSVLVSCSSTALSLVVGLLAAFVLGRVRAWWTGVVALLLLVAQVFPEPFLVIPTFLLFKFAHIGNPFVKMIIAHVSFVLPLSTWLLANYIRNVPSELEAAARIDGATWTQVLWYIIVPVAWPGIIAATVFAFLTSWGDFLWGLVFGNSNNTFLLPVGIQQYAADVASIQWGVLLAMAVLYTIPVVVFFFTVQRGLVRGLSGGALKG